MNWICEIKRARIMSRRIECPKCGTMNQAGNVCECFDPLGSLQMENIKLKLEIAGLKNRLAEVVGIARMGRYSGLDFVAVGRKLDAMDDYLADAGESTAKKIL